MTWTLITIIGVLVIDNILLRRKVTKALDSIADLKRCIGGSDEII